MGTALTIIVPVHNGEESLARTLEALAPQVSPRILVVIALNGCNDSSRGVAEKGARSIDQAGGHAHVLVSERPSRAGALNAADVQAHGHRVYLDQDAVLSAGGLALVCDALDNGAHFVGAPAVWRCGSRLVQAAMGAWNSVPYVQRSPVTAGMYAISEAGRKRWRSWPQDLPDDKFARLQFDLSERRRLSTVTYTVDAPRSFRELVAARTRYARYNAALRERVPEILDRDVPRLGGISRLVARPALWPGLAVLTAAEAMAKMSR